MSSFGMSIFGASDAPVKEDAANKQLLLPPVLGSSSGADILDGPCKYSCCDMSTVVQLTIVAFTIMSISAKRYC